MHTHVCVCVCAVHVKVSEYFIWLCSLVTFYLVDWNRVSYWSSELTYLANSAPACSKDPVFAP